MRALPTSLLIALVSLPSVSTPTLARQDFRVRLDQAVEALERTEIEAGIALLNSLLADMSASDPVDIRTMAHFRLGEAHFALGAADSAVQQFAAAISGDPFFAPDADLYQPSLIAAFESTRRTTVALGLRAPNDTILSPVPDRLPLDIAIGAPGDLTIRVVRADGSENTVTSTTLPIDGITRYPLPLLLRDSVAFEPGLYRLIAVLTVPGMGTDSTELSLSLERLPADTTPRIPPLDSRLFLPEFEKGPPPASSLLKGLLFGAAVAAIPIVVASSDLSDGIEPRAVAVGASISIAGIVGLVVGRPDMPVEANIAANQRLVNDWQARDRSIADENRARVLLAPLRVTVEQRQ